MRIIYTIKYIKCIEMNFYRLKSFVKYFVKTKKKNIERLNVRTLSRRSNQEFEAALSLLLPIIHSEYLSSLQV